MLEAYMWTLPIYTVDYRFLAINTALLPEANNLLTFSKTDQKIPFVMKTDDLQLILHSNDHKPVCKKYCWLVINISYSGNQTKKILRWTDHVIMQTLTLETV